MAGWWWLEHDFYFHMEHDILRIIIPFDSYFSEGLKPPTRLNGLSWKIMIQMEHSRVAQETSTFSGITSRLAPKDMAIFKNHLVNPIQSNHQGSHSTGISGCSMIPYPGVYHGMILYNVGESSCHVRTILHSSHSSGMNVSGSEAVFL